MPLQALGVEVATKTFEARTIEIPPRVGIFKDNRYLKIHNVG